MKLPDDPRAILTLQEAADFLRVKRRQVTRYGVPVIEYGRKGKGVQVGDLLAWVDSKRKRPPVKTKPGA